MDLRTNQVLQSRQRDENTPERAEGGEAAPGEAHFTKRPELREHHECGGMRFTSNPVDAKGEKFEVGKVTCEDGDDILAPPP